MPMSFEPLKNKVVSSTSNILLGALGHHALGAQQIVQGHEADNLSLRAVKHHDELRVRFNEQLL